MANKYTVDSFTTQPIDQTLGILDHPSVFPPASNYFLTLTPEPGEDIAAINFRPGTSGDPMTLSLQGVGNSLTQWPSLLEWTVNPVIAPVPIYKIVFQDSENLVNNINFTGGGTNQVYVWIYFGLPTVNAPGYSNPPGQLPVTSTVDMSYDLDIDYDTDVILQSDTLPAGSFGSNSSSGNVTGSNI